MKTVILLISTFLLLPALSQAQKTVFPKEATGEIKSNKPATYPDSLSKSQVVKKSTRSVIQSGPDHMPILIPGRTYDRMSIPTLINPEITIDKMPNAIPKRSPNPKPNNTKLPSSNPT